MKPVLILDLGGVLANLGSPTDAMGLNMGDVDFWSYWLNSDAVRDFELGATSFESFCQRFADELPSEIADKVRIRLKLWELHPFPGITDLIECISRMYELTLLSNTNPLHWDQLRRSNRLFDRFSKLFLSFETGKYKPEPESYLQVAEYFGRHPKELSFIDDSENNIRAAQRLGIRARQASGPIELERAIMDLRSPKMDMNWIDNG